MEIQWTVRAADDFFDILTYIKQQSPQNAAMISNEIRRNVEKLKDFPKMGVVPKDIRLQNSGYRVLIVEKYLIFYVIDADTVKLAGIVHGAQRYSHLF